MKTAFTIVCVVIVLVTGVPIVMAAVGMCADCDTATMASSCLFAVLSATGFVVSLVMSRLRRPRVGDPSGLFAFVLERPPRPA